MRIFILFIIIVTIATSPLLLSFSQVQADPGNSIETRGDADGVISCEGRNIESDFSFDALEVETGNVKGDFSLKLDIPGQREEFETQHISDLKVQGPSNITSNNFTLNGVFDPNSTSNTEAGICNPTGPFSITGVCEDDSFITIKLSTGAGEDIQEFSGDVKCSQNSGVTIVQNDQGNELPGVTNRSIVTVDEDKSSIVIKQERNCDSGANCEQSAELVMRILAPL